MRSPKAIIGILLIVAFSAFALYSFRSALNPYVTFAEAARSSGKVQVSGYLEGGNISYDSASGQLRFYLVDSEGTRAKISYNGPKPDNMEHAESVVVIGSFEGDIFKAERLLVKCPSKYEKER